MSQNLRLAQLVTKASLVSEVGPVAERPNRVNLERYRENLTAMVTAAHSTGIRIILVTAPSHHVPGAEPDALAERHLRTLGELIPQHRAYVEATRLIARQVGAKLCDVAAAFDLMVPPADQYFQADGIHLSKAGDRALAALLTTCIVEAVDGDLVSGMGACGPSSPPEQPCSGVR
jgi:lysophospholipase L1-like esterase